MRVTTAHGWVSNIQYAGFFLGLSRGYFADHGVEADFIAGGPNAPDTLVSLAAGRAQVCTANWNPFLDARARGNDFVLIGAQWKVSPSAIISLAGRPLHRPEDMVGMRILTQNPSDSLILDTIFDNAGLPRDYTAVPTGFSPEPLLAGDGDAYLAFATNQPITLEQMGLVEGQDFHVTLLTDLGYRVMQGLYLTRRDFLDKNRDAVTGYMAGMIRGWRAAVTEPDAALDLVLNEYGADLGLDPQQQARQNELQIPLVAPTPEADLFALDAESLTGPMTEVARATGREVPPLHEMADLEVVPEALALIS
ncbi:ABC transporter substrate-binding protein [Plastorhodobacter daqingensis]|uniref:Thiamine pyrimidine synthase n=2 Tax=Rhodobacterales TaxID=204455 RepID=A0A0B5DZX1_9RHOB|nr:ABC transporter substrate-binding protein [Celeribacter indicus]AJE46660.1 twin-arginine translocation pathway signal [Celeribacter indicus]SDX56786.1 ABC-type nitrate/sulfonate/bicarbonate transport system, substrate-binding protein [Celeribacter indicus]